jgi:hypothetical protein
MVSPDVSNKRMYVWRQHGARRGRFVPVGVPLRAVPPLPEAAGRRRHRRSAPAHLAPPPALPAPARRHQGARQRPSAGTPPSSLALLEFRNVLIHTTHPYTHTTPYTHTDNTMS